MSRNWMVTHPNHQPFITNKLGRALDRLREWGTGSKIEEA